MGPEQIHLTDAMVGEMLSHAESCKPEESCGLIAGESDGATLRAVEIICLTNAEPGNREVRYLLDAREQLDAMRAAEAANLEIIGAFHSHVASPAWPSPTDLSLAAYPEWAWVIISLEEPDPALKAFAIDGEIAREIEVAVD